MPPVAGPRTRLFIFGSLPGERSLAEQRYYAHPTNQFWRLLGGALDEPLAELPYAARLQRLASRGVGLWDVVAAASRSGSLDGAIRGAQFNRLAQLIERFPELRAVAFNGQTAARAGRKALAGISGIELIELPSSSAALTRPLAAKAEAWQRLGRYALPRRTGSQP